MDTAVESKVFACMALDLPVLMDHIRLLPETSIRTTMLRLSVELEADAIRLEVPSRKISK